MFRVKANTDCNGFVIFDPTTLERTLGRRPTNGENLLKQFWSSTLGDDVTREGAVVPIFSISDDKYDLCIRSKDEPAPEYAVAPLYGRAGPYPLHVVGNAYFADAAVMEHWLEAIDWCVLDLQPGCYSVEIGAHVALDEKGHILCSGFDIVVDTADELPVLGGLPDVDIDIGDPRRWRSRGEGKP